MESYKEMKKIVLEKQELEKEKLLGIVERKKICGQQYSLILKDIDLLAQRELELKEQQVKKRNKKTKVLRTIEMICLIILLEVFLVLFGQVLLPLFNQLFNEAIGVALIIFGYLSVSVANVRLIFELDFVFCSRITKKLEQNGEYKKLLQEIEINKFKMDMKNIEKDKKINEYNNLFYEEEDIRKKMLDNDKFIEYLDLCINEDNEIEDVNNNNNNNLVRKKVKGGN